MLSPFESQKIFIISDFMHEVGLFCYKNQQKVLQKYFI